MSEFTFELLETRRQWSGVSPCETIDCLRHKQHECNYQHVWLRCDQEDSDAYWSAAVMRASSHAWSNSYLKDKSWGCGTSRSRCAQDNVHENSSLRRAWTACYSAMVFLLCSDCTAWRLGSYHHVRVAGDHIIVSLHTMMMVMQCRYCGTRIKIKVFHTYLRMFSSVLVLYLSGMGAPGPTPPSSSHSTLSYSLAPCIAPVFS